MSNTHSEHIHLLRCLSGAILVTGIFLVMNASSQVLTGQVSSQGSTILKTHTAAEEMMIDVPAAHSVSFIPEGYPGLQGRLLFGMLLILLGFALYTMWFVQQEKLEAVRLHRRSLRSKAKHR